jgi:hypothetical protein
MRYGYGVALLVLALAVTASADTWDVKQDGSGHATTIQGGIDLAGPGDIVRVFPGVYSPSVNGETFPIEMGNGITLQGCPPDWEQVIVDAEGTSRVFLCTDLDQTTVIEGFTIQGGEAGSSVGDAGGGVYCVDSDVEIRNCMVINNHAHGGGGICAYYSPLNVIGCIVSDNAAVDHGGGIYAVCDAIITHCMVSRNYGQTGGGIYCAQQYEQEISYCTFWENSCQDYAGGLRVNTGSVTTVNSCTFYANAAPAGGGGVAVRNPGSTAHISNCIVSFSTNGEGVQCDVSGTVTIQCSDVYGNAGGDFVGYIAGQEGINGNFQADPMFCDADGGDFYLWADSPCAAGNHPDSWDCGQIGALGIGCGLATIDIDPDVLNVYSLGLWITCYIELPDGYDPTDIDVSTLVLNGTVPAEMEPICVGDYDMDGIPDLMVKFSRSAVIDIVPCAPNVEIEVRGEVSGEQFVGWDMINVICRGQRQLKEAGSRMPTRPVVRELGQGRSSSSGVAIRLELPEPGYATLTVHDVTGRLVRTLMSDVWTAEAHTIVWNGRTDAGARAAAGVYFLRLAHGDNVAATKIFVPR